MFCPGYPRCYSSSNRTILFIIPIIQNPQTSAQYCKPCTAKQKNRLSSVFYNHFFKLPVAIWKFYFGILKNYHLMITLPQVNPLPKAAKTTVSPDLIFPCSQASVKAIGMEAAVVLPYFWILL